MVLPPDWPHDDVGSRITKSLVLFVETHGSPGNVYHPQAAIYANKPYLEPDMMYVSNELAATMGKRRTSADIVFEYISKSSANYDRTTKAYTYLALGIQELWLIDSQNVTIEVWHKVTRDEYPAWRIIRYEKGEFAESRALEGWRVSVDELFAGLV